MATDTRLVIRLPEPLIAAAQEQATRSGQPLARWARGLIEAATGVSAGTMGQGFAGMTPERHAEISAQGGAAKVKNAKKTSGKHLKKNPRKAG